MKGARARALAGGLLLLAAICLAPAVSAAQDPGTTTTSTVPTTTTTASPPPLDSSTTTTQPEQQITTTAAQPPAVTVSGPNPKARAAASASVNMVDFSFAPGSVTVAVGDTVTWHNTGQAPHTATAGDGSFDTGTIQPGGSGSHTFNSPGTFSYICTIHPNMKGTVRVLAASSGSSGSKGGGSGSTAGSSGSSSSSSSSSEAAAVNSPGAAGSSTSLPATGMAAGAMALVGFVLLASGLLARHAERRARRRWRSSS